MSAGRYCSQCLRRLDERERGACSRQECLDAARAQVLWANTGCLVSASESLRTEPLGWNRFRGALASGADLSTLNGFHFVVPKPVPAPKPPPAKAEGPTFLPGTIVEVRGFTCPTHRVEWHIAEVLSHRDDGRVNVRLSGHVMADTVDEGRVRSRVARRDPANPDAPPKDERSAAAPAPPRVWKIGDRCRVRTVRNRVWTIAKACAGAPASWYLAAGEGCVIEWCALEADPELVEEAP